MPPERKKPIKPVILPGDAQLVAKLQQDNKRIQEELGKAQEELKSATVKMQTQERARSKIEAELLRLKPASRLLDTVTADSEGLWTGLRSAITEISKKDAALKEQLQIAEKKESEYQAGTTTLRSELDLVLKREQSGQIKALAQITELQKSLKTAEREHVAFAQQAAVKEAGWTREQDALKDALKKSETRFQATERTLTEYRKSEELFTASLAALHPAVPSLAGVEPKPVSVMKALFQELLEARQQLGRVSALEAQLKEEQAKNAASDKLDSRIGSLVEENRLLQEQLDGLSTDSKLFAEKAKEATATLETAVANAKASASAETEKQRIDLDRKVSKLEAENVSLLQQMDSTHKVAFVPPERVSALLDEFYANIRTNLKGLDVQDSEVRLKVGFGSLSSGHTGFVIPTAGNTAEIKDSLGEVVLRLGKKDR
ncbi:coiled-coil domain-containing protein [Chlorobium phaeobacteroides]|uniref:Uncharacterized protein n=1 Tax=Chlorobium phaeobacteroides (strain DSM 266 / SMG 266 / 2430) TaxID=290317 RepID=A1BJU5_CHLPD|nr:hypothetical protein [Chlorobium phaeobacteroides]ABL66672.1 hypothetical protein Cpha266_2688 [Chlorobium phaeobacteroides DSM 266]